MSPPWEPVIGLEVHVQLATRTKIFCRCPNRFGAEPNTLVCPVCVGYPGTLPVLNRAAVDLAVRLALALAYRVAPVSVFARKNYFYADLPKGYQTSQYDRPLASGGELPLAGSDRRVRIHRLHLEEDAVRRRVALANSLTFQLARLLDLRICVTLRTRKIGFSFIDLDLNYRYTYLSWSIF